MSSGHKVASIPKGLKFTAWVIATVLCVMCLQLWIYERKWSQNHPDDTRTNALKVPSSLFSSSEGGEDGNHQQVRGLDETSTLRELLNAVSSCTSDPSAEVQADTAECLDKLFMEYPALRTLQPLARMSEESSTQQQNDRDQVQALEKQVLLLNLMLRNSTQFMELKDTREAGLSDSGNHWFMSTLKGPDKPGGGPEEFEFPSEISNGRILCFLGNSSSDGTKNKYAFAYKGYLPEGSTLLPGLTLVVENYWDYTNIWHSMSALVSFISIRARENCVVPSRLLLFHWGELVESVSPWIDRVLHACFGKRLKIEKLNSGRDAPVCLERAIVNRRGLGRVSIPRMNSLFETIRCRTHKFCSIVRNQRGEPHKHNGIDVTLLLRSGARELTNATSVQIIIARECEMIGGCRFRVSHIANLSFCEQVVLMSSTDVLVSTHGAQLTNMMFMPRDGYVMELMPKGWLEFAGVGQYIYTWLASWANLNHEGIWRDPVGPECHINNSTEPADCFSVFKDLPVGYDETYLSEWTSKTLYKAKQTKEQLHAHKQEKEVTGAADGQGSQAPDGDGSCTCEHVDDLWLADRVNSS